MAMVDTDWSIDRATGNIRYGGDDHTLSGGTPSYATVIQFHRWIAAWADDEAFSNDDEHDIIDKEASTRSTDNIINLINGFNITSVEAEHLYDGTITQGSGATAERWDGIVNFGNADAHLQVLQNGAIIADDFWNYGHEAGSETGGGSATVMTDSTLGATVDEFIGYTIINVTDGSRGIITDNDATTVTVAELYGGTLDTWTTADVHHIATPLNGDATQGISHRFLVKTVDEGVAIDRRRLIGTSRRYGNTFSEFKINGTSQGNNVFALSDAGDLNNTTSWATIDAIADITNTEGLRLLDIVGDGTADEEYWSEWTRGAQTINDFYQYLKMSTADATAETLQGQSGELLRGLTHSLDHDAEAGVAPATNDVYVWGEVLTFDNLLSGPFTLGERIHGPAFAWSGTILGGELTAASGFMIVDLDAGTLTDNDTFTGQTSGATADLMDATEPTAPTATAGRGRIYAYDDQGTTGSTYMQVDKGVAPVNDQIMYEEADEANTIVVNVVITERTISTPFVGVSTGSALIGSYGLGMVATDTTSSDTFFDLTNTAITPPNTVTFTASGMISGDRVLCTEDNAGDINFTQMALNATYSGGAVTTISVNAIPSDTPLTGTIRIQRDDGLYSRHPFSDADLPTDDFTITSHDFSTNNATTGNNCFVSYLDLASSGSPETFQYVYSGDRTHFLRVRDGGATPIKTAEATGVMTITGGTAAVNRIDDT